MERKARQEPFLSRPENLAWRKNLRALRVDWEVGELSFEAFFEAIVEAAEPAGAAETLEIIGPEAAGRFEHWFTALHGSRFSLADREDAFFIGGTIGSYSGDGETWQRAEADWRRRRRVIEAFHRAVLARREPT